MPSVLDHPTISSRYFFPRRDAPPATVPVEVEGATLACAKHTPHGPEAPLLVHFHGNGEVVADYVPDFAEELAKAGFDTFFAEYRGYGASSGSPALVQMLGDVAAVLDSLDRPLDRVFVYGRSVGSIYAIEAAHARNTIGGLILESGIASPLERVLLRVRPHEIGVTREEMEQEAALHLDHERKLAAYPGRTLVLHAANDHMVDASHAERNARWARSAELVLFERGDHNSILAANLPAIIDAVRLFAAKR
jgi:alpha-beta hydrolase superfamily lysophospholipase